MNFEGFKEEFFAELDTNGFDEREKIKSVFRDVEFNHQTEYDSVCRDCKTWFNADRAECPNCGSKNIKTEF